MNVRLFRVLAQEILVHHTSMHVRSTWLSVNVHLFFLLSSRNFYHGWVFTNGRLGCSSIACVSSWVSRFSTSPESYHSFCVLNTRSISVFVSFTRQPSSGPINTKLWRSYYLPFSSVPDPIPVSFSVFSSTCNMSLWTVKQCWWITTLKSGNSNRSVNVVDTAHKVPYFQCLLLSVAIPLHLAAYLLFCYEVIYKFDATLGSIF